MFEKDYCENNFGLRFSPRQVFFLCALFWLLFLSEEILTAHGFGETEPNDLLTISSTVVLSWLIESWPEVQKSYKLDPVMLYAMAGRVTTGARPAPFQSITRVNMDHTCR